MSTRSWSPGAYRKLNDPINEEGPWGIRDNPSRPFYTTRKGVIRLIGLHITAGATDLVLPDYGAENVVKNWGANKANTGASWHGTVDSDSIVPGLPDWYTAWVQGVSGYSFNSHGIGLEIARRQVDWRSNITTAWRTNTIRNAAIWAAPRVIKYGIPLRLVRDRNEVQRLIMRGQPVGFAYHGDLAPHNRRDPGLVGNPPSWRDTFPIEMFLEFTREEVGRRTGNVSPKPKPPAPAPAPAPNEGVVYEVMTNLNTRSGPGTSYEVVGFAPKGTTLLGSGEETALWVRARTPYQVQNNLAGTWWSKSYLKVVSVPKPTAPAPAYPTLKKGSKGEAVKNLQSGAIAVFPAYAQPIVKGGGAIGYFGNGTEAFVKEFQRRSGLTVDGVVGERTWTQLGKHGIKP